MSKVKGYKMFNADWTCRGFKYEVGKTYTHKGEISLCAEGFHFCKELTQCFKFYDCVTWNKIAEVEALGKVIEGDKKCVTNKIKIVREIPFDEIKEIRKENNRSYGINYSEGINESYGINHSEGINHSKGIKD